MGGFPESSDQPKLFSETLSLLLAKKSWGCGSGAEHPPGVCEALGSILSKTLVINPLRFLSESDKQLITEAGGDCPSPDSGHSVGCP